MRTRTRQLRESKKMTQTALGLAIGCAQNTISKIESEKVVPSADILCKLADYFHTTTDYLLYRTDERYPTNTTRFTNSRLTQYMFKLQELTIEMQDSIFCIIDIFLNKNIRG